MSTDLQIRITAELGQIKGALASLQAQIGQVGTKANASAAGGQALASSLGRAAQQGREAATAAGSMQRGIAGAVTQVKLLFGGLGALGLVTGLVRAADTTTRLNGQLRLVTKTQEEFNRAQAETFEIAQRTRQGLEGTVNLYARIARAGRTSQQQTLQLTESINQAVALSFTTAAAAEAALFQLGQGLGSGTLRGEELNSVLEQTPRLATAIAEGLVKLGKIDDPGDLREFARKNGIEAKLVVDAIATQQARLREEFAKLEPTVADAFTAVKNEYLKFIGDTNSATGASRSLANAILALANNFDRLAGAIILFGQIYVAWLLLFRAGPVVVGFLATSFAGLRASIALATPAMRAAAAQAAAITARMGGAAVATTAFSLSMTGAALATATLAVKLKALAAIALAAFAGFKIGQYLKEQFLEVELAGIALAGGLTRSAYIIGQAFRVTGGVLKAAFNEAFNFVKGRAADLLDNVARVYGSLPGNIGKLTVQASTAASAAIRGTIKDVETAAEALKRLDAEGRAGIAAIDAEFAGLAESAIAAADARKDALGGDGTATTETGELAEGIKGVVKQLDLLKDAAERALVELDQLYEDAGISTRRYFAEKIRLQQASIDVDIAQAQAEAAAATTTDARSAALTRIVLLERARRRVAIDGARDQVGAEQDLVDKLGEVQARLLELSGDTAQARTQQLRAQYRDLIKRLEADSDTAGLALVARLINVEAAKAGLDQFKTEFTNVTGALSQLEQTTAAQVNAGLLSNATGEARLKEARTATLAQLREQRQAVAELYAAYKDPAALQQLQAMDQQIAQLSVSTEDWRGKIQDAATGSITTFFTDIATRAKTAGEAVRDLALGFTRSLAEMAAASLSKKAVNAISDLFTKKGGADGGAEQVASAAAAGLAYATPVTGAATAMTAAGATLVTGAAAVSAAAVALQAAAATLIVANSLGAGGIAHSGGIAGMAGQMRYLPAGAWANAPRYHTGGIAGLGPNEVTAVLERGEEVITKTDSRHRFNGGLGAAKGDEDKGVRLVVVDDQRAVGKYLESAAGERVIVRAMQRNKLS